MSGCPWVAFARLGLPIVGFDVDQSRIAELISGYDRTCEVEADDLVHASLSFSSDPEAVRSSDFYIVTVPTPIDQANRPDLGAMFAASRFVGGALKKNDIVVYESTVYPGAIEEECIPILAEVSGLKPGADFTVGYSPERINPGDKQHRFENIAKVVSAQDRSTLDIIAEVYGAAVTAGIHRAPSIKVAEAAKVIENTQRDLNIAFMNELSLILKELDIDTRRCAGGRPHQVEFPPVLSGPGRRPLHRRGSLLSDLPGRKGRLSSGSHPGGPPHQRQHGPPGRPRMYPGSVAPRGAGRNGHDLGMTFKENVPDTRNSG